ncbi:MAG: DNA-processing protein DprA [Planctomycetes bacterium]|nr:DNA-processing protein DprA [Planctomycetota bacterium]MCB9918610.1 DNA-processing protein DprA [Planctomycetota bacterium]
MILVAVMTALGTRPWRQRSRAGNFRRSFLAVPFHIVRRMIISPLELLGSLNTVERKYAPERLWVSGHPEIVRQYRRVSIVGSRKATDEGLRRAARLARELVEAGIVVVSGLAAGIDHAAHRAAIACGGRNTI